MSDGAYSSQDERPTWRFQPQLGAAAESSRPANLEDDSKANPSKANAAGGPNPDEVPTRRYEARNLGDSVVLQFGVESNDERPIGLSSSSAGSAADFDSEAPTQLTIDKSKPQRATRAPRRGSGQNAAEFAEAATENISQSQTRVSDVQSALPAPTAEEWSKLVSAELDLKYELGAELGRGGMGRALMAHERSSKLKVVIKLLQPIRASDSRYQRFRREAEALRLLSHPHIVALRDEGVCWAGSPEEDPLGVPYLVMDFVRGSALSALVTGPMGIKSGPSIPQLASIFEQISRALAACHKLGIIHRDVKPGNIVVDPESGQAKLIDFGLARAARGVFDESISAFEQSITESGQAVGTPMFMAPEQLFGEKEAMSTAADIWGVGASLYFCLTGSFPYDASTPGDLVASIEASDPPLVSESRSDCPDWLTSVVADCMHREPELRPSAAELSQRLLRGSSRPWLWVASGVAIVALCLLSLFVFKPQPPLRLELDQPPTAIRSDVYQLVGRAIGQAGRRIFVEIERVGGGERLDLVCEPDGHFRALVNLEPGRNRFVVSIFESPEGARTSHRIEVTRETP